MASKRLLVIQAVITRLQAILKSGGFNTDAGETIFVGESVDLGENDPSSAIAVVVGTTEVRHQMENLGELLPIGIHAMAKAALDDPGTTVEHLIEDIKKAVEIDDRRLGGLLKQDLERGPTERLDREPGTTSIGMSVIYNAFIVEGWGKP